MPGTSCLGRTGPSKMWLSEWQSVESSKGYIFSVFRETTECRGKEKINVCHPNLTFNFAFAYPAFWEIQMGRIRVVSEWARDPSRTSEGILKTCMIYPQVCKPTDPKSSWLAEEKKDRVGVISVTAKECWKPVGSCEGTQRLVFIREDDCLFCRVAKVKKDNITVVSLILPALWERALINIAIERVSEL